MNLSARTQKVLFVLAGLFFFVLFAAFTLIVRGDYLKDFDFNTTVRLQQHTPLRLDPLFSFLSVIGRLEYTAGALAVILILRRKIWGIFVFILFGFTHVFELVGKTILDHPSPPHMFLRSQYSDFPGLSVHTDASYPSGHSLRIIFITVVILYFFLSSKRLSNFWKIVMSCTMIIFAGVMVYSRITLGEHWTTDVIGGSFLGAAVGLLSLVFL
jgi:undecaprenyl-diphosphatase